MRVALVLIAWFAICVAIFPSPGDATPLPTLAATRTDNPDSDQVSGAQTSQARKIAFSSYYCVPGMAHCGAPGISTVNADRTGRTYLVPGGSPDWSPDGATIAYYQTYQIDFGDCCHPDIFTVRADGSGLTNLTNNENLPVGQRSAYSDPAWSPDGSRIAFKLGGWGIPCHAELWIMNPQGLDRKQLTSGSCDGTPAWSPNGGKIAFTRGDYDDPQDIYVVNADGTNPRRLIENGSDPSWSPDGSKVAFSRGRGYDSRIYVANSDGSNATRITSAASQTPAWSPDGDRIAFTFVMENRAEVYTVRPDGTELTQVTVTSDGYWDGQPAWQPDPKKAVLFISGVPSDGKCDFKDGTWAWARDALAGIVSPELMLRYVYTSGTEAVGQCPSGSWDKSDSCWSLNDTYVDRWTRKLENDWQAKRLKTFIHNYLTKNAGVNLSIVAHSQGGVLATYVVKELLSEDDQKRIETVVTLDSPLRGVLEGAPLIYWYFGDKCGQGLSAKFDSPQDMICKGGGDWYQAFCSDVISGISGGSHVAPSNTYLPNIYLLTVDARMGDVCLGACIEVVDSHHSQVQWSDGHLSLDTMNHGEIYSGGSSSLFYPAQRERKVLQYFVACGVVRLISPSSCSEYANRLGTMAADRLPPWGSISRTQTVPANTSSLQTVASTGVAGIAAAAAASGEGVVTTTLISPSNRRIDASTNAPDVEHHVVGGYESFTVAHPEPGEWTIEFEDTGGAGADLYWFATSIPGSSVDGDGDAVRDESDNCVSMYNVSQSDADGDGLGDDCDTDYDGDGIPNESDNCVFTANADQLDANGNHIGDACDPEVTDLDGDGVPDALDNCPLFPNPAQTDADGDGVADGCIPVRGDTDCDQDVDAVDALNVLRNVAGLPVSALCLASSGDINCDDDIDSVDALGILRYVAGLPINQPQGCAAIGRENSTSTQMRSFQTTLAARRTRATE